MMRFDALAVDYDGTLADEGVVDLATVAALERLRATGRRLLMVTGRTIEELSPIFSRLDMFEVVVGENGAVLYYPATKKLKLLHDPPPASFIEELRTRGVPEVYRGHIIACLVQPHELIAIQTIKDLGLELQIIFNKGSVMVLPTGVNKATGLDSALQMLGIPAKKVVAVGDAENDHAFLRFCGFAVAVNNALPALKKEAHYITKGNAGSGVREVIELLMHDLENIPAHGTPQMAT